MRNAPQTHKRKNTMSQRSHLRTPAPPTSLLQKPPLHPLAPQTREASTNAKLEPAVSTSLPPTHFEHRIQQQVSPSRTQMPPKNGSRKPGRPTHTAPMPAPEAHLPPAHLPRSSSPQTLAPPHKLHPTRRLTHSATYAIASDARPVEDKTTAISTTGAAAADVFTTPATRTYDP